MGFITEKQCSINVENDSVYLAHFPLETQSSVCMATAAPVVVADRARPITNRKVHFDENAYGPVGFCCVVNHQSALRSASSLAKPYFSSSRPDEPIVGAGSGSVLWAKPADRFWRLPLLPPKRQR